MTLRSIFSFFFFNFTHYGSSLPGCKTADFNCEVKCGLNWMECCASSSSICAVLQFSLTVLAVCAVPADSAAVSPCTEELPLALVGAVRELVDRIR